MAEFTEYGLDQLRLSLEEIADIPEGVLLEMLSAQGEVVKQGQERRLAGMKWKDESTGQLARSIQVSGKLKRGAGAPALYVYPQGVRRDGKTRNAEVGFLQEYGAPRRGVEGRQWMRLANEESAEEAVRAAAEVYSRWLEGEGL